LRWSSADARSSPITYGCCSSAKSSSRGCAEEPRASSAPTTLRAIVGSDDPSRNAQGRAERDHAAGEREGRLLRDDPRSDARPEGSRAARTRGRERERLRRALLLVSPRARTEGVDPPPLRRLRDLALFLRVRARDHEVERILRSG